MTNWWEHLFSGKTRDEAGELEEKQGTNIARAAAKTSTLEHYIWSTLPSAKKLTGGKLLVPHLDYKVAISDYIKSQLPDLAAKTTYLSIGYYPQNMAYYPMLKPFEIVSCRVPFPGWQNWPCAVVLALGGTSDEQHRAARHRPIHTAYADEAGCQDTRSWRYECQPRHLGSTGSCQRNQNFWKNCTGGTRDLVLPADA